MKQRSLWLARPDCVSRETGSNGTHEKLNPSLTYDEAKELHPSLTYDEGQRGLEPLLSPFFLVQPHLKPEHLEKLFCDSG
ncbi:hypothetical protein YC2023_068454 [Brassica napus]